MDGLQWKTLLKWMIWGYHYFRKRPFLHSLENSIFDREEFRVHYPPQWKTSKVLNFSVWGDFCWLILRWEVCKKPSTYPPSFTTVISAGNPISSITPLRNIRGKNSTRTFSSWQFVIAFHWFWFPNRTVPKKSYRSSLILSFSRCFFWWVERPLFGSSINWQPHMRRRIVVWVHAPPQKEQWPLYDPGYLLHVGDSTCHESLNIIRCHKEFVALKTVLRSRNSKKNLLPLIKKTSQEEGFWSNTGIDKWLFVGVNRDILPPLKRTKWNLLLRYTPFLPERRWLSGVNSSPKS